MLMGVGCTCMPVAPRITINFVISDVLLRRGFCKYIRSI